MRRFSKYFTYKYYLFFNDLIMKYLLFNVMKIIHCSVTCKRSFRVMELLLSVRYFSSIKFITYNSDQIPLSIQSHTYP